jgi:hypothetical protein
LAVTFSSLFAAKLQGGHSPVKRTDWNNITSHDNCPSAS